MAVNLIGSAQTYATPPLWEDFLDSIGGTGTLTETERGQVVFEELNTTTTTVFDGTTPGSFNIILEAVTAARFNASAGALRYNTAQGAAWEFNATGPMLQVVDSNFILQHLQLRMLSNYGTMLDYPNGGETGQAIDRCIIYGEPAETLCKARNVLITNSLFIHDGAAGAQVNALETAGATVAYNTTFVRTVDAAGSAVGVLQYPGSFSAVNCAVFGFKNNFDGSPTGSNNASDLAIGFGTSNQASKVFSSQFNLISGAGMDFRLKSGADCINTGTTSGAPTTDVFFAARDGSTDIGLHEFQSGGGSAPAAASYQLVLINSAFLQ
jgi:hypothetical protein